MAIRMAQYFEKVILINRLKTKKIKIIFFTLLIYIHTLQKAYIFQKAQDEKRI